jgi:hypothetical protein
MPPKDNSKYTRALADINPGGAALGGQYCGGPEGRAARQRSAGLPSLVMRLAAEATEHRRRRA